MKQRRGEEHVKAEETADAKAGRHPGKGRARGTLRPSQRGLGMCVVTRLCSGHGQRLKQLSDVTDRHHRQFWRRYHRGRKGMKAERQGDQTERRRWLKSWAKVEGAPGMQRGAWKEIFLTQIEGKTQDVGISKGTGVLISVSWWQWAAKYPLAGAQAEAYGPVFRCQSGDLFISLGATLALVSAKKQKKEFSPFQMQAF